MKQNAAEISTIANSELLLSIPQFRFLIASCCFFSISDSLHFLALISTRFQKEHVHSHKIIS